MENWHGTTNGYGNRKCRCEECRTAWNKYHREHRGKARAGEIPSHIKHGTRSTYGNWGCRCDLCKAGSAEAQRRWTYKLPEGAYGEMLERQDGRCAVCQSVDKKLQVDHDHETGLIRGLLCFDCNTSIGKLGDSVEGLRKAIDYLQRETLRFSPETP